MSDVQIWGIVLAVTVVAAVLVLAAIWSAVRR